MCVSCSVLGMVVLGSLALGRGAVVHQVPSLVAQVAAHGGAVANHVPRLATVVACLEAKWTDTAHVALAVAPAPSQHGVRPLGSSNTSDVIHLKQLTCGTPPRGSSCTSGPWSHTLSSGVHWHTTVACHCHPAHLPRRHRLRRLLHQRHHQRHC